MSYNLKMCVLYDWIFTWKKKLWKPIWI